MKIFTNFFFAIISAYLVLTTTPLAFATPVEDLLLQVRKARQEARYKDGRMLIDQAFALAEPNSREMAKVLRARGMNYVDQGHSKEAIPDLEKSLSLFEKIDGKESDYAASLTNDVAVAYYGLGNLDKALDWYSKALKMREKLLGVDHVDVAQTLNNIAWCHRELHQPDLAEAEFTRAIAIVRKKESNGRALSSYLYGLGSLLEWQGKLPEALPFLEEASLKADTAFGDNHPESIRYRKTLKKVQRRLNKAPVSNS